MSRSTFFARYDVVFAAAGLITFFRADQNHRVIVVGGFAVYEALRSAGRFATHHADGTQLGDFFRHAQQLG